MIYPRLDKTPIKEIIFSISYDEIVDKECFDKFVKLDFIKEKFNDIKPSIVIEFSNKGISQHSEKSGFHLRNENEVLQLRTGSFSYHFLNTYRDFNDVLATLINFWNQFDKVTKDNLTITSLSARYINVIEIDEDENLASRMVQLYPKQSSDRKVINFQNSVQFNYKKFPDYLINVVSTKPQQHIILLDITVNKKVNNENLKVIGLKKLFEPLQEIKNKVFFDSITAKALIKYINLNS